MLFLLKSAEKLRLPLCERSTSIVLLVEPSLIITPGCSPYFWDDSFVISLPTELLKFLNGASLNSGCIPPIMEPCDTERDMERSSSPLILVSLLSLSSLVLVDRLRESLLNSFITRNPSSISLNDFFSFCSSLYASFCFKNASIFF